jgi:hypothetical protein
LKVATAADQFAVPLRVNVPENCPVDAAKRCSFAAREVLGTPLFCCNMVKPLPAVAVRVELAGSPTPAKTNSLFEVVVAVAPELTLAAEPWLLATLSRGALAFNPLYS